MSVKERLIQYLNEGKKGKSQAQVARAIGKSQAALNQWLHDKYPGDEMSIEKAVEKFLNRERARDAQPNLLDFVMIETATSIHGAFHYCHVNGIMGIIHGPAGYGKTKAAEEYVRQTPDTILLTAKYKWGKRPVLHSLAVELNLSPKGQLDMVGERISSYLKGSDRLIIVDEAQFLVISGMETLRQIHDYTKLGIVLVGMPELYRQMLGRYKEDYEQIYSRVILNRELKRPGYDDIEALARANDITDNNVIDYMYLLSKKTGCLRVCMNRLQMALRYSRLYDLPLSVDLMKETEQFML